MRGAFQKLPGTAQDVRIGVFGGSFNPAHAGHFHVALTAMNRLDLDFVWWLVARGNPLKAEHGDFDARFASAASLAQHPRMIVSTFEAEAGFTYTVNTLAALQRRAPNAHFVWLMGADNLGSFHKWSGWQTIARDMPIAVVDRPGYGLKSRFSPFARRFSASRLEEYDAARLPFAEAPAWVFLKARHVPLSSTELRRQRASLTVKSPRASD